MAFGNFMLSIVMTDRVPQPRRPSRPRANISGWKAGRMPIVRRRRLRTRYSVCLICHLNRTGSGRRRGRIRFTCLAPAWIPMSRSIGRGLRGATAASSRAVIALSAVSRSITHARFLRHSGSCLPIYPLTRLGWATLPCCYPIVRWIREKRSVSVNEDPGPQERDR